MALELAALLGAAKAATGLLNESRDLVRELKTSGFLGRNGHQKEELETKMRELQENLRNVGRLADFGAEYTRTHQDVLQLLWDCERAESFLKENEDACADREDEDYRMCWRVLDTIFESIGRRRDPVLRALDDRSRWFTEQDRSQIDQRLKDAALSFERASTNVRVRAALDAAHELRSLTEQLERIESALRRTLYDNIFHELGQLAT